MDYAKKPHDRMEGILDELDAQPDRAIHELYYGCALHDCSGLADMTDYTRDTLLRKVELACIAVLCPTLAIGSAENEIYLLLQGNPEISLEGIAQAAGAGISLFAGESAEPLWAGYYSAISLEKAEADALATAFREAAPAARDLFEGLEEDEE